MFMYVVFAVFDFGLCMHCVNSVLIFFLFFKQKTAYEMRISDWSSDVCSSDLTALRFMGRAHDVKEGLAALKTAQNAFKRVSFDLIYARPEQSEAGWQAELEHALSSGTSHLSLYQLTIEPGTRFEIGSASCRERVCQYV